MTGDTCKLRSPASPDDWAAYHAIRRHVLFELRGRFGEYDANHPDEHRANNYPRILVHEGEVIGVIRIDVASPQATFRRVAVREDSQRQGYGRQLIRFAEAFALAQSCHEVVSFVDEAAIGFYQRCGFVRSAAATQDGTTIMTKRLIPHS